MRQYASGESLLRLANEFHERADETRALLQGIDDTVGNASSLLSEDTSVMRRLSEISRLRAELAGLRDLLDETETLLLVESEREAEVVYGPPPGGGLLAKPSRLI